MLCTTLLSAILLFGDSRCLTGFPSQPTLSTLLAQACPTLTITQNCAAGRGVYQKPAGGTLDPIVTLENALAAGTFDACLLQLGVNDWLQTWATPQDVAEGLRRMGDVCIAASAQPIILTGMPASDGPFPMRGAWNAEVRMRQIALGAALGWPVIDSWDAFDERTWSTACTWSGTAYDGVHPWTQACRQTWAEYVAPRLP